MWGHSTKALTMNQEADPLWTVNLLAPWPWTSQFPELWEIHFCCSWATWLQYFVTVAWTDVEQQCQQHFCCGDGRGTQGSETELSEVGRCGLSMLFKHFLPRRTLNIVDAANMALANCFPYPCDLKTAGTRAARGGGEADSAVIAQQVHIWAASWLLPNLMSTPVFQGLVTLENWFLLLVWKKKD